MPFNGISVGSPLVEGNQGGGLFGLYEVLNSGAGENVPKSEVNKSQIKKYVFTELFCSLVVNVHESVNIE
jgi:hypothetical protein